VRRDFTWILVIAGCVGFASLLVGAFYFCRNTFTADNGRDAAAWFSGIVSAIGAFATAAGTCFAIFFIRGTNKTLEEMKKQTRSLQEQTRLLYAPRLRAVFAAVGEEPPCEVVERTAAGIEIPKELAQFENTWKENLDTLKWNYGTADWAVLILKNPGQGDIQELEFMLEISASHHESMAKAAQNPVTQFSKRIKICRTIENDSPGIAIRLISLAYFPTYTVRASNFTYVGHSSPETVPLPQHQVAERKGSNPGIVSQPPAPDTAHEDTHEVEA